MKASKKVGRPKKHAAAVSKEKIHACALEIVNSEGVDRLSFRSLAKKLGVTPMAISYHVGNRDQMITAIIARAFVGISVEPPAGTPCQRVRHLLLRYCDLALLNSNLVQCLLREPTKMPGELAQFTELIRQETQKINSEDKNDAMLNLLIDYIHGFIFSAVAAPADTPLTSEHCAQSLDWLLAKVE